MNQNVELYINYQFQKIKPIKKTDKGEIWLASDRSDSLVILREMFTTGLPYKFIKLNPHPIFPKVLYCAEDETETIVVEEYVQGVNLRDRLKRKEYLTQDEAKNIILQLCDGLALLHDHNIIHRDITPANLILQGNSIKLIDFDIARTYKEGQSEDTQRLGTKGYAPPEQYGFGQTDARSDIYSLGLTMQQLLGSNYSGFLKEILSKCTEIDINKRYQSVYELKYAINNYQQIKSKKPQRLYRLIVAFVWLSVIGTAIYFYSVQESRQETIATEAVQLEESVSNRKQAEFKVNEDDDQKSSTKFKFPDIVIPAETSNQQSTSPSTSKVEMPPLPNQQTFEISKKTVESEQETPQQNEVDYDYVKVEYYENGKRLNSWVDNWDYDITNTSTICYIPSNLWKDWQAGSNRVVIPSAFVNLQARAANRSKKVFYNPQLEVTYGNGERKILTGKTLQPGEETTFTIPINGIDIKDTNLGNMHVNYIIKMKFSGSGADIRGSATEYEFLLLKLNEPLP